jgi:hypothetical protein
LITPSGDIIVCQEPEVGPTVFAPDSRLAATLPQPEVKVLHFTRDSMLTDKISFALTFPSLHT